MDFIWDLNFRQPATKGTAGTNKRVPTLDVTDVKNRSFFFPSELK